MVPVAIIAAPIAVVGNTSKAVPFIIIVVPDVWNATPTTCINVPIAPTIENTLDTISRAAFVFSILFILASSAFLAFSWSLILVLVTFLYFLTRLLMLP